MAARRQLDLSFLDERDAIARVVVAVAGPEETMCARPPRPHVGKARAALRVLDGPLWRLDVAIAAPAAAGVQRPPAIAPLEICRRARFLRRRPEVEQQRSVRASDGRRGDRLADH